MSEPEPNRPAKRPPARATQRPSGKTRVPGRKRPARTAPAAAPAEPPAPPPAAEVTHAMLAHAVALLDEVGAAALLVYADALQGREWEPDEQLAARLIYATKTEEEEARLAGKRTVRVPRVVLTRMGQVKVAMFLALSQGLLQGGERVVALAGGVGQGQADTIVVLDVGQEFQTFLRSPEEPATSDVQPAVLARIVELAVDLGSEGREGKPVGTLFVVGDHEKVVPLTRQRILNPFHGYPEERRNVLDVLLEETIKELATVDGAFVVRGDGVVLSSGTYLKTSALPEESLPRGLGARHQAAAAITFVTDCMAVAVSESTGSVTVFRKGQVVTEIEKPQKARSEGSTRG